MAFSGSYITTTVQIAAALPSTINFAGFNALAYTTIVGCMMWGETGDTMEDIVTDPLSGRAEHLPGLLDGGAIPFKFRTDILDPGQILLKSLSNLATQASIKLTKPDGLRIFAYGLICQIRNLEMVKSNYDGFTGEFRVNSPTIIN